MTNQITKEISGMDDFDKNSITTDQALKKIFNAISPINENEIIPIRDPLNRILAENIKSKINVPSARNTAMDGYAINKEDIPSNSLYMQMIRVIKKVKPISFLFEYGLRCSR